MTATEPPRLLAVVSPGEQAVLRATAERLVACISAANGTTWPIRLRFLAPEDVAPSCMALVTSMVADVDRADPIDATATRWRQRVAHWQAAGVSRILMCTPFRHVADRADRPATIERIRRLVLLAIDLSRTTGIEIVDIDQLFTQHGARTLATDYRCTGEAAARLAGHAIAGALLDGDLTTAIDAGLQEKARRIHGGGRNIAA